MPHCKGVKYPIFKALATKSVTLNRASESKRHMKFDANKRGDEKFSYIACVFGGFGRHPKRYAGSICKFVRFISVIVFLVIAQGHAFARPHWTRFVATAYSVSGETKSQAVTQEGRTIAADPRVLPIGTVVEVRNAGPYSGQYVVQDTGPRIVGRKIDIYIAHVREAIRFGMRRVRVRIVKAAPETPKEQRRAAIQARIAPKPPKSDRVSEYYQYPPSEGDTAGIE